jgi:hypothetical protein
MCRLTGEVPFRGLDIWSMLREGSFYSAITSTQQNALRLKVDALWYVPNTIIRRDLQIPTVKEEIRRYSSQCSARPSTNPNDLIVNLIELPDNRRFQRHLPNDLPTRFLE